MKTSTLERSAGVYEIVNRTNGARYIGSSVNMRTRWAGHRCSLNNGGKFSNKKLYHAWRKYGEPAFEFRVLLVCKPEDCEMYEQIYIDALNPRYNIRKIAAGSNLGVKRSPESITKGLAHHENKTVRGVTGSVKQLAEHFAVVTPKITHNRVGRGWSLEDAVLTPLGQRFVEAAKRRAAAEVKKQEWEESMEKYVIDGVEATLADHVRDRGATTFFVAYARIKKLGWDPEKAVMTPSLPTGKAPRLFEIDGEEMTAAQISEKYRVPKATFFVRVREGMTPVEAATTPVRKWVRRE